jgi:beta-glucosidase
VKKLAVIGRLAAAPNTGDTASSNTNPAYVVTPLAGSKAALKGKADMLYDDGSSIERAAAAARAADAVVLIVGYTHNVEGEFLDPSTMQDLTGGDRNRLSPHPEDGQLIRAIADVNPRTVVAVMSGSAVPMEAWRERVTAILMLWYPGMEGGHALADVLQGRVNPSGKLPFVIPNGLSISPS